MLTLNVPSISESCIETKIKLIFIFTLLCGALKGFMKAFIKPGIPHPGSDLNLLKVYFSGRGHEKR